MHYLIAVLGVDTVAYDVEIVRPDLQEGLRLLRVAQETQSVQRQLELGRGACVAVRNGRYGSVRVRRGKLADAKAGKARMALPGQA